MSKLSPFNSVLLVIETKSPNANVIISATYSNKENLIMDYANNQREKLVKMAEKIQPLHKSQLWVREKLEQSIDTNYTTN